VGTPTWNSSKVRWLKDIPDRSGATYVCVRVCVRAYACACACIGSENSNGCSRSGCYSPQKCFERGWPRRAVVVVVDVATLVKRLPWTLLKALPLGAPRRSTTGGRNGRRRMDGGEKKRGESDLTARSGAARSERTRREISVWKTIRGICPGCRPVRDSLPPTSLIDATCRRPTIIGSEPRLLRKPEERLERARKEREILSPSHRSSPLRPRFPSPSSRVSLCLSRSSAIRNLQGW
jgi:hypothetical protein